MRIESGPAGGERNYWLLVSVVCVGLTLYFIYDGSIGWPEKNVSEAQKRLPVLIEREMTEAEIRALPARPTKSDYETVKREKFTRIEQVRNTLGADHPIAVKSAGGETVEFYASREGVAKIVLRSGVVDPERLPQWEAWYKPHAEIQQQFLWAILPGLFALYAFYRLYDAVSLRVVVDETGMKYGRKVIPFDAMTSLRDYSPKGWVDLYHRADGERESRLRLDNQKVREFDAIVDRIAQAKGWENPVTVHRKQQESDDADQATPS